jgi:hypothetical protein
MGRCVVRTFVRSSDDSNVRQFLRSFLDVIVERLFDHLSQVGLLSLYVSGGHLEVVQGQLLVLEDVEGMPGLGPLFGYLDQIGVE